VPAGLNFWTEEGVEAANVTYDAWFNNQIWGAAKEEVSYIVDCVRKGESPTMITPVEALSALKVALALISSAATERDVKLN
jgi:predicted dehydrogenase